MLVRPALTPGAACAEADAADLVQRQRPATSSFSATLLLPLPRQPRQGFWPVCSPFPRFLTPIPAVVRDSRALCLERPGV